MKNNSQINQNLKLLRVEKGLSQERFGKKIGLSGKSISAYENNRCIPSLKVLEEISKIYDYPLIQLKSTKKVDLETKIKLIKDSINEIEDMLQRSLSV